MRCDWPQLTRTAIRRVDKLPKFSSLGIAEQRIPAVPTLTHGLNRGNCPVDFGIGHDNEFYCLFRPSNIRLLLGRATPD